MLKIFIILLLTVSTAIGQVSFSAQGIVGEWEMIGISVQNKEMPELKGLLRIYIYENNTYVFRTSLEGVDALYKGIWHIDETNRGLIHLTAKEHNFEWKLQALDMQTMVVEDLNDKANITFRKKVDVEPKLTNKKLEGRWYLTEAAGKLYSSDGKETANILLIANHLIEVEGFSNFEKGQWALTEDAKFLILSDQEDLQVLEILYCNSNALILRDGTDAFFFRRKMDDHENINAIEKRLLGTWSAESPQLPILNALLLFQKDGTMNGISNLNSELHKWELRDHGKTLLLMPFLDNSKEEAYRLRLYMVDKNVIVLSDEEWTVVFKKH